MQFPAVVAALVPLMLLASAAPVLANDANADEGAVISVNSQALGTAADYAVVTAGQVVIVGGQRAIVVREPGPAGVIDEAPPEPRVVNAPQPVAPFAGAIWVAGHWSYGSAGFAWVSGRYTVPKAGHVFVPPRWAFVADQYFFFAGYFVPYGVLVRSHFNRFYYSGHPPNQASRTASRDRGPYWPIGVSGRGTAVSRSRGRGPYWPIGLRGSGPVGLRPSR